MLVSKINARGSLPVADMHQSGLYFQVILVRVNVVYAQNSPVNTRVSPGLVRANYAF